MPDLIPDFDLYAELEIGEAASGGEIEAAWRALMKRNHPDLGPTGSIHRSMRLNVAHDWLKDADRRARYDAARAAVRRRREGAERQGEAANRERQSVRRPGPAPAPAQKAQGSGARRESRSGRPRPGARSHRRQATRMADPTGRGGDWRRTFRVVGVAAAVVAILVVVAVTRLLVGGGVGGRIIEIAAATPAGPPGTTLLQPTPGAASPSRSPSPSPSPTPSPPSPTLAASPAPASAPTRASPLLTAPPPTTIPAFAGGGSRGGLRMTLDTGTYSISYVVSAPAGAECGWVLWLTDASGFESLVASAYPLPGTTVQNAETATNLVVGAAAARVASDCPQWSFTMTPTAP